MEFIHQYREFCIESLKYFLVAMKWAEESIGKFINWVIPIVIANGGFIILGLIAIKVINRVNCEIEKLKRAIRERKDDDDNGL